MFWLNKQKTDKRKAGNTDPKNKNSNHKNLTAGSENKKETSVGTSNSQCQSREDIHAQALANARAARENLGDDTIRKIAAAMAKMNGSPSARAKAQIQKSDAERVAFEILWMIEDKN